MSIIYTYDSNSIMGEAIKSNTDDKFCGSSQSYTKLRMSGMKLTIHRLDNKYPEALSIMRRLKISNIN